MTLDEYEQTGKALYAAFADTVESILRAALKANGSVRFQAIQKRAKDISEVRKKLNGANANIEASVKDLAGARIVVYSNSEVARLNQSEILRDNFEIDWERTKFHYPRPSDEAEQSQFVGHNYVVRLNKSRAALPEYRRFAELQCEIQVQTILDHAWSETAHDTIYKSPKLDGVGAAQLAKIKERMRDVQQKYLQRAGYEFQHILNDFEHIVSGQRLVDSDILTAIRDAPDNNMRIELLDQYDTVVLPLIDDKASAAPEIRSSLIDAARNAHALDVTPIGTPIGPMSGRTHEEVLEKVITILANIRYIEPADAYSAFADLHQIFVKPELRQKVVTAVGDLAQHALHVWRRFGPAVQEVLLDAISATPKDYLVSTRPLMIETLGKCLESEVTGTSSTSNAFTWETGPVMVSDRLHAVRDRALDMLRDLFSSSQSDVERATIYHAMQLSTRLPTRGGYDDALLERVLRDTAGVTTFLAKQASKLGGLLKEKAEQGALFHHRRASKMPASMLQSEVIKSARDAVVSSALALRERFNEDEDFAIFKTLVGFESVFLYEWDEERAAVDFAAKDAYRKGRAAEYMAEVTEATADEWFNRINSYASVESDDLATFPNLGSFVAGVSEKIPAIALSWLNQSRGQPLARFAPGMLRGLYANDLASALAWINAAIDRRDNLHEIAHFIRFAEPAAPDLLERVARESIAAEDDGAVFKVLEACAARPMEFGILLARRLAVESLMYLSNRGQHNWTEPLWLWGRSSGLLMQFDDADRSALFAAIRDLPKIDYRAEEILAPYAEAHAAEIVDLFGARLERERAEGHDAFVDDRFEGIPFDFSQLHKSMQHVGPLLLPKALEWHRVDPHLSRYKGARLVANMFPELPENVILQLIDYAKSGDCEAQEFVINVMSNYDGAPVVFIVLKELVAALSENDEMLGDVRLALSETGIMRGEFGYRDAIMAERKQLEPWLSDERELVAKFAEASLRRLNNAVAAAQQSAEADIAMRKLSHGEPLDDEKPDNGDSED
jgi:ppGpp synthetase/RelA/SpoT-type nucleotidyltranferase